MGIFENWIIFGKIFGKTMCTKTQIMLFVVCTNVKFEEEKKSLKNHLITIIFGCNFLVNTGSILQV